MSVQPCVQTFVVAADFEVEADPNQASGHGTTLPTVNRSGALTEPAIYELRLRASEAKPFLR